MIKKRFWLVIVCLLLVFATLSLSASALGGIEEQTLDFSSPSSSHNIEYNSADILERLLSETLSDVEYGYLARHGGATLKFDTGITTEQIETRYESGTLSVTVRPYVYTAENGTEVTWTPSFVTLGDGEKKELSSVDDGYFAEFYDVEQGADTAVKVEFTFSFILSETLANSLINKALNDAPALKEEIAERDAEYERLTEQYEADIISYGEYIAALSEYESEYALYTEYLSKKKVYDDALAEYEAYLREVELYEQAVIDRDNYQTRLAEYNAAYAEYREYLKLVDEYNAKNERYIDYLDTLELIRNQLYTIELAKVKMTGGRQVYSAIMGNMVTDVLANRDLITSELVDASPEVIDLAGESTENLRVLLKEYFALTEEEDKYAYYTVNFEPLRDNFTSLLQALDNLYRIRAIRAELVRQDKDKKYIILVSQLFIIATALNDGEIYSYDGSYAYDSSFTISVYREGEKTPLTILENKEYITDTDSREPIESGYPQPVPEPEMPEYMAEPVKPTPVRIPAIPEPVAHPGDAPTPVVDEPQKPTEVTHPGDPPTPPSVPNEILALIEAFDAGEIQSRSAVVGDIILTESLTVEKKIFDATTVSVIFYSESGEILYETHVDRGTKANYRADLPEKAEDQAATYVFGTWCDSEGNPADLSCVTEDLELYPHFIATPKFYTVTFDVCGTLTHQTLQYGSMPNYVGTPEKPDDTLYEYTFSGWDKEIVPVSENVTYTAEFDRAYLLSLDGDVGVEIEYLEDSIVADCQGVLTDSFNISKLVDRAITGQGRALVIKTQGYSVKLSYATLLAMRENGEYTVRISVTDTEDGVYTYAVSVLTSDGSSSENSYRVSLDAECGSAASDKLRLYYNGDEGKTYVPFSFCDGRVSFTATAGTVYTLCAEYAVNVIPSTLVTFDTSRHSVQAGGRVELYCDVPPGIRIDKMYLIAPDGTETVISGDYFLMPDYDVTVGVIASYIEYRVTFMNGFKVITTHTYRYGDTVVAPKDPKKAADGLYTYEFLGWSPAIDTVTADVTYVATYKSVPVTPKEDPGGLQITESVMKLLIAGITALALVVLVVIPGTVIIIVNFVRLSKKRIKRSSK